MPYCCTRLLNRRNADSSGSFSPTTTSAKLAALRFPLHSGDILLMF
jgi:hypothetical protein